LGRVIKTTPQPLYARERDPVPNVHDAGWVPGPVWTGAENLIPPGFVPRTVQSAGGRVYYYGTGTEM